MKTLTTALLSIAVLAATAQETPDWTPKRSPLKVFATYEDMVADKGVEGVTVNGEDIVTDLSFSKPTLNVIDHGEQKTIPMEAGPYWGFTDGGGQIVRMFKKGAYICYALGDKVCFYQMVGTFEHARDWMSDGPTADIEGGARMVAGKVKEAGLKDAYDDAKPKREMKDSVEGYQAKLRKRDAEFIGRINGDSAVK